MEHSVYQKAILDWVSNGTGNAVVEAVAGAGKSTTLVEVARMLPGDKSACFLAFNKHIADELSSKLPSNVQASTLNSIGYKLWRKHVGFANLEKDKLSNILHEVMPSRLFYGNSHQVIKMVTFARKLGLVPEGIEGPVGLVKDTNDVWLDILVDNDLMPDDEDFAAQLIGYAREAMRLAIKDKHNIDFDEQIYLPVVWRLRQGVNGFDWVFIDELQDTDPLQREMVGMLLKPNGRLMGVGDTKQAIYKFRGADIDSMQRFAEKYNCIELPLSICYRCPTSHIDLAKKLVPQIEPRDNAPQGTILRLGDVREHGFQWNTFKQTDLIVCRSNAPLVKMAYILLSKRIPCRILGRDICTGIVTIIKKTKAQTFTELYPALKTWMLKEKNKILKRNADADTTSVDDKLETMHVFMENSKTKTVAGLLSEIDEMFANTNSGVLTLSTVHKAKGLTVPRCFVLKPELLDFVFPGSKFDDIQVGRNIKYIAFTRATDLLGFIDMETDSQKKDTPYKEW